MRLSRRTRLASVALLAVGGLTLGACSGGDSGAKADKFVIAYNGDGGHDAWVDAVSNQLKNNLGITAEGKSYPTFDELRTDITERKIKTAFRTGWQPDYPSIFNYLQAIYQTKAGSNDGDYSSKEFDDLITKVAGEPDAEKRYKLQDQAQEVLLKDLPATPLWYANVAAVAAKGVENVSFNWQNVPEFQEITKADGGAIAVDGSEPQNPLLPTATNEVGGGDVINMLYAGLVSYKSDGASENDVAESITSKDNLTWTIKIKADKKFSDGSPVTAKSFVDAWNFGALSTNKQLSSYFFYPIKGFEEAQAEKPTVKGLSGLKVVDDSTFTIELNQPEADFPARLGYSSFYPLPESAFDDIKAYGENPIGNGPYKMAKKGAWEHDKQIALVPSETYNGVRPAKNDGLTFKFYTNLDAAYTDVQAGNLDVLDTVPDSGLATFEKDTKVQPFSKPGSVFQSFTIAKGAKHFGQDKEGDLRRQAISMAINREEITEKIFNGTRTPAKEFSSPVLPGYNDSIPGNEVLEFNPEKAKELWAEANKISAWNN